MNTEMVDHAKLKEQQLSNLLSDGSKEASKKKQSSKLKFTDIPVT